jgi:hypothetical protein
VAAILRRAINAENDDWLREPCPLPRSKLVADDPCLRDASQNSGSGANRHGVSI